MWFEVERAMSEPAIQVAGLSKQYRLGETCAQGQTLGESIYRHTSKLSRRLLRLGRRDEPAMFHALRDVSFEVEPGQVLGIVGSNGAGKSTLLKILSRVTDPTAGRAVLRGRMASLLEVGTGFHPELTGRENIFLNGAILGMSRREVAKRFDEIVDFSGVEKFLDTPVKRYSSGMRVRLAFAVAAHLEPEILIIDEVLAVGDAAFQKKCLGKMDQFAQRDGRTILFVSHQITAIENLCQQVLWLDHGQVRKVGLTTEVLNAYLRHAHTRDQTDQKLSQFRLPNMEAIIQAVRILDAQGQPIAAAGAGSRITVQMDYQAPRPLLNPSFAMAIDTAEGHRLAFMQTRIQRGPIAELPEHGTVSCDLPSLPLAPGSYSLSFGCAAEGKDIDLLPRALPLDVYPADVFGTGHLPQPHQGRILLEATWHLPDDPPAALRCAG